MNFAEMEITEVHSLIIILNSLIVIKGGINRTNIIIIECPFEIPISSFVF